MTDIIVALIAGVAGIVVAWQNSRTSKFIKSSETRAARRAHESRLAMELMYNTCNLAMMTARHVKHDHDHGQEADEEIEKAISNAEKAQAAYVAFVRDEASKNFAKV